jgi:tetratricopeptide (TPR) repeat protein
MERAKQALAIAETAEHPLSEALGWLAIGHVLRRKGELDGAIGALERGIELCDRYTLPLWRMRLLSSLGIAYACTGRVDEGLDLCRRALSDAEVMRVIVDQPMFLVHIGIASLVAARMEDALECGKQALDLAMAHETKTHQAWARFLIGHALLASDSNLDYPAKELAVAHQLALACEAHPLAALCQAALASVHERGGNAVAARELLTAADAMFRKLDMRPLLLN